MLKNPFVLGFAGVLFVLLLGFFVPVWLSANLWLNDSVPHKFDEELIANFENHKEEFERLLQMVKNDKGLFRVDADWTSPDDPSTVGISSSRVREYREIFKQLQIPRGFYAYHDNNSYLFISSAQGLAVSGSSKSYYWTAEPCKNMTDDIDKYFDERQKNYQNLSPKQKEFSSVCRHIEGNWYLIFDWD